MIGSLISAGLGVAGALIGSAQAAKATKEANRQLDNMQAMEKARYYNNMGDSMHRADVVELSKQVYDNVRAVNEAAMNPIVNTTVEGANAIRQQNNEMVSKMAGAVNADNTKLRMKNENIHAQNMNNIARRRRQAALGKAQQITNATQGAVNSIIGDHNLFDSLFGKKKEQEGQEQKAQ